MLQKPVPANSSHSSSHSDDKVDGKDLSTEERMIAIINKSKTKTTKADEKSPEQELAELEITLLNKAEELAQKTPPQLLSPLFEMSELEAKAPNDQAREFIRIVEFIQQGKNNGKGINAKNEDGPTRPKLSIHLSQIQKYSQQIRYKEPELLKKQKGLQLNKAV